MKLTEQLTKRLGRSLYRGSGYPNWDESVSYYKCFYASTEPSYALYYATNDEDKDDVRYVTEFALIKPCDLFNANSDRDLQRLVQYIRTHETEVTEKDTKKLLTEDWLKLGNRKKEEIIEILKTLNFDGFVNFEHIENFSVRKKDNSKKFSFSGIGIFNNTEFLKEIKTYYGFEEIIKIEKVKQDRDYELECVKIYIEDHYELDPRLLRYLAMRNSNGYLVKPIDIDKLIKGLNKKELKEYYHSQRKRKPIWK